MSTPPTATPHSGVERGPPRPARVGQALAEHWQGRAWLSGGSGSCNAVSAGEPGEGPLTGFWECRSAPLRPWPWAGLGCHDRVWAWRRRGEPRWELAWPDEAATMAGRGCVSCSCTPCIWMWKLYSNTFFFFFFFCILCLRKWSNKFWSISKKRIQFSRKVKETNFFWVALSHSDGLPRWTGWEFPIELRRGGGRCSSLQWANQEENILRSNLSELANVF